MSDQTPEPNQQSKLPEAGIRISKIWVPVILVLATLLGVVLADTIPAPPTCPIPDQYYCSPVYAYWLTLQRALQLHVILSTIEIVLLISLVAVYVKVYAETRANFSLGLIIVLGALTIHSFLSYPLVVNDVEPILGGSLLFPYADLLTIVAYSVFLYLSLE